MIPLPAGVEDLYGVGISTFSRRCSRPRPRVPRACRRMPRPAGGIWPPSSPSTAVSSTPPPNSRSSSRAAASPSRPGSARSTSGGSSPTSIPDCRPASSPQAGRGSRVWRGSSSSQRGSRMPVAVSRASLRGDSSELEPVRETLGELMNLTAGAKKEVVSPDPRGKEEVLVAEAGFLLHSRRLSGLPPASIEKPDRIAASIRPVGQMTPAGRA